MIPVITACSRGRGEPHTAYEISLERGAQASKQARQREGENRETSEGPLCDRPIVLHLILTLFNV